MRRSRCTGCPFGNRMGSDPMLRGAAVTPPDATRDDRAQKPSRASSHCCGSTPPGLGSPSVLAVIFADDALAPAGRLWSDAVDHLARKLGRVVPLDPAAVPGRRADAVAYLDEWAGQEAGNWRTEVERFVEGHVPVYVRPDPELNAVIRQLAAAGPRLAVWSPGPDEALHGLVHFLGVERRLQAAVASPTPLDAVRATGVEAAEALLVSATPEGIEAG